MYQAYVIGDSGEYIIGEFSSIQEIAQIEHDEDGNCYTPGLDGDYLSFNIKDIYVNEVKDLGALSELL